jgi:hypothetical protein
VLSGCRLYANGWSSPKEKRTFGDFVSGFMVLHFDEVVDWRTCVDLRADNHEVSGGRPPDLNLAFGVWTLRQTE